MTCTNCGTENKPGRKFCASCGVSLSTSCPACGAANEPMDRFCSPKPPREILRFNDVHGKISSRRGSTPLSRIT